MVGKLTGQYHTWNLLGHNRVYADVTLPYKEAVQYVMAVRYNAMTGRGEQREICDTHCKKLKREMEEGNFTPTQISANLRKNHRENLKLDEKNKTFVLKVDSSDPLPQTDGGHRCEAIARILNELKTKLDATEAKEDKEKIEFVIEELLELPVGIRIFMDGNPQKDFINLQAGRTVDNSHMLSLKIQQKVLDDPSFKTAFEIAKLLNKTEGSPLFSLVRLDSRGDAPLPISTLCQKAGSDLSTSLVGLARVGLASDEKGKDPTFLTHCVVKAYKLLAEKAPDLIEGGKVLATIGNGGKKGSATLMIGLATCLAHRLRAKNQLMPNEVEANHFVDCVKETLDKNVNGNLSGPVKRVLIGKFAKKFFADLECEKQGGVPSSLLMTLSFSTFDVPVPAKPKKQKKVKVAKGKKKKKLPDVDGPVPAATVTTVTNEPVPVPTPVTVPLKVEETKPNGEPVESDPWDGEQKEGAWETQG